jgi:hypothetical protein
MIEEDRKLSSSDLSYFTENTYSKQEIKETVLIVSELLDYQLIVEVPSYWIPYSQQDISNQDKHGMATLLFFSRLWLPDADLNARRIAKQIEKEKEKTA